MTNSEYVTGCIGWTIGYCMGTLVTFLMYLAIKVMTR